MARSLFETAVAAAVDLSGRALATGSLHPHLVLFGNGTVTQLDLAALPEAIWTEACRHERARVGAEVVVQVLAATANRTTDVAIIYAESPTEQCRLVVGDGPEPSELECERIEFFAPADPRIAAALDAARR